MKKIRFLFPLILVIFSRFTFADTTAVFTRINQISESVKRQYCPDKRTSVWKVDSELSNDRYRVIGETDSRPARDDFYRQLDATFPNLVIDKDIKLLPDDVMDGIIFAVPKNSIANLRRKPSVEQELVSQSLRGLPMDILKEENGFYLVRADDGYLGWVSDDRVQEGDENFKKEWMNAPQVVFIDLEGVVFSRPTRKSLPVSDVVMGNRFKLIEKKRKWTKVGYPDGRVGYVRTKSLESLESYLNRPLDAGEIVKTAKLLIGRPYMWGAASPKQMDCSGFTQTVFRQHGYVLQRDASMQVFEGTAVDTSDFPKNLKPGDLLFFSPYPDRITHVGLYIGDGQFIHSSGRVRLDSFNKNAPNYNNYRRHSIRAVRRIIK
ncbi:MAG: hypothetical protein DRP96_02305 [Candidatus Neomarinimicrobiota bacterium]|nr:MAG: hypothetical protein DRP96_02305 [Candidatus Neomarinimicrobiota bacterium]